MINTTKNTIHPLISRRRSIVSFSSEPVPEDHLQLLFNAARWAPSSSNLQPWYFIYAARDNEEDYLRLFNLLNESNKEWAITAPVLMLSVAEVISQVKKRENRYAFHDLGMAVGNLLFQATSLGLYVHQMGGYDVEGARKSLNIPEGYEPGAMVAIGFHGEIDHLPMRLKRKELAKRVRKPVNEFIFRGSWKKQD